jgi:hypothetical protein
VSTTAPSTVRWCRPDSVQVVASAGSGGRPTDHGWDARMATSHRRPGLLTRMRRRCRTTPATAATGTTQSILSTRARRSNTASAPTVVAKSPVHAACSRSRAGRRLTGNSQTSPSVGGGRRTGGARLGEPDGVVWSRLAQRDRTVLALVAEHQVLTTWQLLALVFPSAARAQRRLR